MPKFQCPNCRTLGETLAETLPAVACCESCGVTLVIETPEQTEAALQRAAAFIAHEEIDLDDEDDEILDRVWDESGSEAETTTRKPGLGN